MSHAGAGLSSVAMAYKSTLDTNTVSSDKGRRMVFL